MKNKLSLLFTLLIVFSINAQVDSIVISSLESKLINKLNQQETKFNDKLSEIKTFLDKNQTKTLDELSRLTKNQKVRQSKLDSLEEELVLFNKIALDLEKKINSELTTKIKKSEIKHNQIYVEIHLPLFGFLN